MAISFTGIGSGVQINDIVSAIVNAEKVPFEQRMARQQANFTTDISAIGALKGAMEELATAMESLADIDKYQQRRISGGDDFVSVSSDKDAALGSYSVKVNALAQSQKLMSGALAADEDVGEGTLTFASGGNTFAVDVAAGDNLEALRDKINDAEDNGAVTATIITDASGQHLVLSSKESGVENAITVTVDDSGDGNGLDANGLSRFAYDADASSPTFAQNLTQTVAAQDASITIDGTIVATSSTNEFNGVIDGIDIEVKKAHGVDDDISQLKVRENNSNVSVGLNTFIEKFNALVDLANQLGKADGENGSGPLVGDSLLRSSLNQIRSMFSNGYDTGNGETILLGELGVRTERSGKLTLDSDTLNDQLEADPQRVQNFFIGVDGESGFANDLTKVLGNFDDIMQQRIDGREAQLDKLDDEYERFQDKMTSLESRLFRQYNAMDLLVANMNSTGNYLQQQLNSLPGVVKKSD
ncbi:flagellar filament capping protein FliD [Pseudoalteromonas sp. T1lg48]|uniref:flagellar filament capping protein FliD n=1 Tax=Pseudoalteromonas sp. T1lg48 TaxID=2077100 RepID=UPI000CF6E58C|nr:flagellar filament capping protein FliD [Pseudoalteromonas sp. T1lg48]